MKTTNIFPIIFVFIFVFFLLFFLRKRISYYTGEYFKSTHHRYGEVLRHKGIFGEYLIFKKLQKIKGARLLSSVYVRKRSGDYTEIDVLMVLESGIFVIESKNYNGKITGYMTAKNWTQAIGRKKNLFYNPVLQNQGHIRALKNFLGLQDLSKIHNVICFADKTDLTDVHLDDESIVITKPMFLLRDIKKLIKKNRHSFSKAQVEEIYQKLKKWEHPNRSVVKSQLKHAKKRARLSRKQDRIDRLKFWKRNKGREKAERN